MRKKMVFFFFFWGGFESPLGRLEKKNMPRKKKQKKKKKMMMMMMKMKMKGHVVFWLCFSCVPAVFRFYHNNMTMHEPILAILLFPAFVNPLHSSCCNLDLHHC